VLDWNDIKIALSVARTGSLSSAAHLLEVDQSTVGRRLTGLEASLGTMLFKRSKRGVVLTEAGKSFIARAREIEMQAEALVEHTRQAGQRPAGTVRICGNQWMLDYLVGHGLSDFLDQHPEIDVRMISGRPKTSMWHPQPSVGLWFETQPIDGAFQVKLGTVPYAVYVRRGTSPEAWVSFHDEDNPSNKAGLFASRSAAGTLGVRLRALDAATLREAAAAGVGKALLPRCLGDPDMRLECISPPEKELERVLFLHVHPDSLASFRVQATTEWLRASFSRIVQPPQVISPRIVG
jgi:DNA-binding transcriptional LysR family regulator